MQSQKEQSIHFADLLKTEPDNIVSLDISFVKTLQIGYQAETLLLHKASDDKLTIKEYIGGLSGSEYYAKVTANRFKTTVRYGRRESVNANTCVEIFLPDSYEGELSLSSQYGSIITDCDWTVSRFAAETTEGSISLNAVTAPRIRLASSVSLIHILKANGFTDLHSVSGAIIAEEIHGGAKLATSSGPIHASFSSIDNVVECETLNSDIDLTLPTEGSMNVDGISKRGEIMTKIPELTIRTKPGNIKNVTGTIGGKPFQNVRLYTINGAIILK